MNPEAQTPWTRRAFLRSTLLAAASGSLAVSCASSKPIARPRAIGPNSKLNHACIGVGGMGWGDLQNFKSHPRTQVTAICDVDANHLAKAAALVPEARTYTDWRELLEKEGDQIDSINASVPDHMHFAICYSAIARGKHVYCQKPMCHDVAEVRELTRAAAKTGVVTQLGTQMASGIHDRTAVAWLRQGAIGKIRHAYLCSNRPGAVEQYRLAGPRPQEAQRAPEHLHWDLWLGTAPSRPFAPDIYHPTKWRAWQDFGTGWSGDIGCHVFDPVWKGLRMQPAKTVKAEAQGSWIHSPDRRRDTWPQGDHITWTFPGNEFTEGSELTVEWYDGEYYPPEEIRKLHSADLKEYPPESAMLIGTEGAMLISLGYPPQLLPEERFQGVARPNLPPRDHYRHFMDACLGGEKTESHFAQTGPMTEAILLGTIAVRLPDQLLAWNHQQMRFPGAPAANALLRRTYRSGWSVGKF